MEVPDEGDRCDGPGCGNGRDGEAGGAARAAGSDKRRRGSGSCVGITWDELTWPSTWTDRLGRDRTPVIPGQELAGVVSALALWHDGAVGGTAGVRPHGLVSRRHPGRVCGRRGTQPRAAAGRRRLHGGGERGDAGPDRVAGTVPARPPSGGAERPRARRGPRSRFDGNPART